MFPLARDGVRRLALIGALCAASVGANAETLTGHVVGIADGDTVTVLDETRTQHKVRLAGIDAPEKAQPFGSRSKAHLSELVYGKTVTIAWKKRDRYGRIVGKVITPEGADACLEQLRAGMAWHFKKYEKEQAAEDRRVYAEAEEEARAARRGCGRMAAPSRPGNGEAADEIDGMTMVTGSGRASYSSS